MTGACFHLRSAAAVPAVCWSEYESLSSGILDKVQSGSFGKWKDVVADHHFNLVDCVSLDKVVRLIQSHPQLRTASTETF